MKGRGSLRVAVVGVGHHGRHHARIYGALPGVCLAAVCDTNAGRARDVAEGFGAQAVGRLSDLPADLDAVSVAVPAASHEETAQFFLARGVAVLLEKPVTGSAAAVRRLARVAARSGAVLVPGFIERFNPAFQAIRPRRDRSLYVETVRASPFPFRSLDLGVVMDVMIHDLDLVLSLCPAAVRSVDAVGARVIADQEDVASVRLRFADGAVASLSASRAAAGTTRRIRIFSPGVYRAADLKERRVRFARRLRAPRPEELASPGAAKEGVGRFLRFEERVAHGPEPLKAELAAFLAHVRGKTAGPSPTLEDAVRVLSVAERICRQIRRGAPRSAFATSRVL